MKDCRQEVTWLGLCVRMATLVLVCRRIFSDEIWGGLSQDSDSGERKKRMDLSNFRKETQHVMKDWMRKMREREVSRVMHWCLA